MSLQKFYLLENSSETIAEMSDLFIPLKKALIGKKKIQPQWDWLALFGFGNLISEVTNISDHI